VPWPSASAPQSVSWAGDRTPPPDKLFSRPPATRAPFPASGGARSAGSCWPPCSPFRFGFCSGTIFATFHSFGTFPVSSDRANSYVISSPRTGHSFLHTLAGRPSLPSALSGLARKTAAFTLCLAIGSQCSWSWEERLKQLLYNLIVFRRDSTLWASFLNWWNSSKRAARLQSKYLAAFHTLSLSSRNASQCRFRCRRIVRWNSLRPEPPPTTAAITWWIISLSTRLIIFQA
jgi:hypothetical protein